MGIHSTEDGWAIESGEGPNFREIVRTETSRFTVLLMVVTAVATVPATIDSLYDGGGERIFGMFPVAAPAIVTTWSAVEILWRRTGLPLAPRIATACLIHPVPNALVSTAVWAALGLSPWGQELIDVGAADRYDHYYWPQDARGPSVIGLVLFSSYGLGGFFALMAVLLLVLPVKAFFSTDEVLEGTDLSTSPEHRAGNVSAMRAAFLALPIATVAAILFAAGVGGLLVVVGTMLTVGLLGTAAALATRNGGTPKHDEDPGVRPGPR